MRHTSSLEAGTGEKIQYLVHDFNDNTIRFILHYPGRPDSAVLSLAVKAVIDDVEVLHSSFGTGPVHAFWKMNREYEEREYFQVIETEDPLMKKACEIAALPILPEDHVQIRCHLVMKKENNREIGRVQTGEDGESALVVNISHLCVDGSDGKYLLAKIAEAYRMICESGTADMLCIKDGSRAAEQVYEQLSKKEYLSLMHNPIPGVKSVFPYPNENPGFREILYHVISSKLMSRAKEKASTVGATVNDVLLTACYHAYASLPGNRRDMAMSIMSMMDLRKHCVAGDSKGLCNITGSLPTVLPEGIGDSFGETLADIAKQTREQKEDPLAGLEGMPLLHGITKAFPMSVLKIAAKHVYGSMAVGLTNLGALHAQEFALGNLKPDMAVFGGPLKKKPAMQVSAISLGGSCVLSVAGEMTEEDATLVSHMLIRMQEELMQFAGIKEEIDGRK